MNAGLLTEQLVIKSYTEANVYGSVKSTWSTLATVWAQVLPAASRETWRQSQVSGEINYVVRIRYRTGITAKHRMTWGSKTLEITGPPFEEFVSGSRMLNIPCREVTE